MGNDPLGNLLKPIQQAYVNPNEQSGGGGSSGGEFAGDINAYYAGLYGETFGGGDSGGFGSGSDGGDFGGIPDYARSDFSEFWSGVQARAVGRLNDLNSSNSQSDDARYHYYYMDINGRPLTTVPNVEASAERDRWFVAVETKNGVKDPYEISRDDAYGLITNYYTPNNFGENFSLDKMYGHFQTGGGNTMLINAKSLDFSSASQTQLGLAGIRVGDVRGVNLFNLGAFNSIALAFGKVSMTYKGNNQFQIEPDYFDFNIE